MDLCDHGPREIRTDGNRDHVLIDLFAETDTRIEAFGDDVGQPVTVDDLDLNVGVVGQKPGQSGVDERRRRMFDRGDGGRR